MSEGTLATVPFSVIDQAVHLLDVQTAPWSIQLEVRVHGHLGEARLRAALAEAMTRHPMARARKRPSRLRARMDNWDIAPTFALDPLRVADCPDDESLAVTRGELQGMAVPLTESPPFRAVLARNGDGDILMLNVNHAAMDGFGALRVLRSIACAYNGTADPMPDLDFEASRNMLSELAGRRLSARIRRQMALATRLRDLLVPPARIARDGAADEAGYGFVHSRLSAEQTKALVQGRSAAGSGPADRLATVNDVLVAALHLTIAEWNTQHRISCRRIGVLVPANMRPPEWREEMVGNFSLPARISTSCRNRRRATATLAAVAAQTRRKKQVGMGTAFIELLGRTRLLPLWAKRLLVLALPLTGNRLVDTAMLSNVGRLDNLPSFDDGLGAGQVDELWFSPPARMPLGLTVGAATVAGRLHLVLRFRYRLFDQAAAIRFADLYQRKLHAFGAPPATPPPTTLAIQETVAVGGS
ncbi:MAG: condensation domain-containing protein [Actinomycetota bacterium]|nr:condensation domain-containing protein [Actinomycetota bacterium]